MKTQSLLLKFFLCLVLLSFYACKDNEEDSSPPAENPPNNDAQVYTLDSDLPIYGFDFGVLDSVQVFDLNQPTYDFLVLAQLDVMGNLIGPYLGSPDVTQGKFQLQASFATFQDAEDFYDTLSQALDTSYNIGGLFLEPNQVWVIKGSQGVNGKILITETRADSLPQSSFAQISFLADSL